MSKALDQHEIIALLKDLAIELGRAPRKTEFIKRCGVNEYRITQTFGSFSTLVQAAGIEPDSGSRAKITNRVFEKPIDGHLEEYKPREIKECEPYKRTLFVPDTHFPFSHQATLEKIYRFAEKEQPEIIVQVGDLYDCYSHAKFPRSHNQFTPKDEQRAARMMAEAFWKELRRASPSAKCIQILGNHDLRPLKRALEVYPSAEDWIARMVAELMTFEGVETVLDSREEVMLPGDVAVIHGYKSQLGQHRDHMLLNAVCGHQHVGGVAFRQIRGRVLWELNCGLAGDPESKGLSYTAQKTTNWTLGFGWLDELGPRFVPL